MATFKTAPVHGLTDYKLAVLPPVAHLEICTAPQLAHFTGLSYKTTRDHTLDLFRHGLLERTKVPVMSGTAPWIYRLSKEGAKHLGLSLFPFPAVLQMPHELEVRDFRVWLELLRRHYGHEPLKFWKMGAAATIGTIVPDAVFVYLFKEGKKLTGMVEIDRGTEPMKRWEDKFARYEAMMKSGDLKRVMGEDRGRILIVTPDSKRRDAIVKVLSQMLRSATIEPHRFWVTEKSTTSMVDLLAALWRVPESTELRPLLPDGVL